MTPKGRFALTAALVAASFAGGAFTTHLSHADTEEDSPYAPLAQLGRVLVFVENNYVDPVERNKVLDGVIKGMVAELDPHSAYMTAEEFALFNEDTEGTFGGIGVEVDFKDEYVVVISPVPGAPAARAGIKPGDKIVAVDNKLLRDIPIDKIVGLMRGPPNTKVKVSIKRDGEEELLHFTLTREHVHIRSAEGKRLTGSIAYLRLKQFQSGSHKELLEEIGDVREGSEDGIRGAILDLRGNPGGLIDEAEGVADEFLSSGSIYSTRHRGRILDEVMSHYGGALAGVPLVVLVNEYSASSSELVAGALQDNHRARIIGARTFGKGSVQTIFQLPGGAGMRLTTMRYYTPAGHSIQAQGIYPDVLVTYSEDETKGTLSMREDDLDGHLAAEGVLQKDRAKKTFTGKKAPEYTPIDKVPVDPRGGEDFGLEVAYKELLEDIARQQ
jgi:carboxyl-terminal processing protease